MARKPDEQNAAMDGVMMDIQVLAGDIREAVARRDGRRVLELADRIDDLAYQCNGARNDGKEEYLTCGTCPIAEKLLVQGMEVGRQMYRPLKLAS